MPDSNPILNPETRGSGADQPTSDVTTHYSLTTSCRAS